MDELKKLEEKIRLVTHEKNKYLTIFESLPNPVILADEKNQFEYMNHAAALLFENSLPAVPVISIRPTMGWIYCSTIHAPGQLNPVCPGWMMN